MNNLNFIDLFAGASGMSEGFIKAGLNPIAHIEMNEEACYTIKTRAAFHYLNENKKLDIYNKYLQGKISEATQSKIEVRSSEEVGPQIGAELFEFETLRESSISKFANY